MPFINVTLIREPRSIDGQEDRYIDNREGVIEKKSLEVGITIFLPIS